MRVELGEICHFKAYVHPIMQFISLDISFHLILNHFSEIVSSFSEGSFKTPSAGNHLELCKKEEIFLFLLDAGPASKAICFMLRLFCSRLLMYSFLNMQHTECQGHFKLLASAPEGMRMCVNQLSQQFITPREVL